MKRAVWIICQHAGSPRHGMNFRPYNVARELAARGVDVTVVSGSTSHEYYAPPVTTGRYTFEDVDGLRYLWIRTPPYEESRSAGRAFAWAAYLRGLYGLGRLGLPAPDAIAVSSPPPYPIVPAARLARRYGARLVFEVRDIWPLSLVELGHISTRHPFIRMTQWVEDYAYARADVVVSALPAAEPHMRSRGLANGMFRYIPNGVRVAEVREGKPAGIVRAALPGRRFIIGYLGKVGIAYGLDTLVGAASLLAARADIGIAVIGDGTYRAELEAAARRENLGNIAFVPPVPKDRVPDVLAELDACYLGLKDEPVFRFGVSPTKLFDYMLAAKPVIMGIRAGNDPVAEAGCGITVPPEDPGALAEAVKRLADAGPAELERMGRSGRAYVEREHDWSALGDRYFEALGLDGGPGR
jgi:glycosyltransferase involved in cell wall biosynthesis